MTVLRRQSTARSTAQQESVRKAAAASARNRRERAERRREREARRAAQLAAGRVPGHHPECGCDGCVKGGRLTLLLPREHRGDTRA